MQNASVFIHKKVVSKILQHSTKVLTSQVPGTHEPGCLLLCHIQLKGVTLTDATKLILSFISG